MIAVLLLGCATRTPPAPLWSQPIERVELAPVDLGEREPDECPTAVVLDAGEATPCAGTLLPSGGVTESMAGFYSHRRRDLGLTDALDLSYAGREMDRAYASDRLATCQDVVQLQSDELRVRRTVGPLGPIAGALVGIGLSLGVYWAADRL